MAEAMDDVDDRPSPQDRIREKVLDRARKELTALEQRPVGRRAPDLRTVRSQLLAVTELIHLVLEHITLLHSLAYDRSKATEHLEGRSGGGRLDYTLDTHGDPRARELYNQLAQEVLALVHICTPVSHEIIGFMKGGEQELVRRRLAHPIPPGQVLEAIERQRRRIDEGETDRPLMDQPEVTGDVLSADQARSQARELEAVLGKLRPTLTLDERAWLTTQQVDAHARAVTAFNLRVRERDRATQVTYLETLQEVLARVAPKVRGERGRLTQAELAAHRRAILSVQKRREAHE